MKNIFFLFILAALLTGGLLTRGSVRSVPLVGAKIIFIFAATKCEAYSPTAKQI